MINKGQVLTYDQIYHKVDRQAQERSHRLIEGMKQAQGITECLKEENALEWTGRMNNVKACEIEIVDKKIIYS